MDEQEQRGVVDLGKQPRRLHRRDQRVAAGLAWLLRIASASEMQMMRKIDAHLRRRLRAILLRHWKRKRTIVRNLIALGVKRRPAWKGIYQGHRSWWALSHSYPVDQGLRTRYFTDRGLLLLVDIHHRAHRALVAPVKPQMVLWE
jgi:hypothetical protein